VTEEKGFMEIGCFIGVILCVILAGLFAVAYGIGDDELD